MLSNKKLKQWIAIVVLGIAVLLFVYLFRILFPFYHQLLGVIFRILTPFFVAGFIAYILHPVVERLHHYHLPRSLIIVSIYALFFGGIVLACYYGYPIFIKQMKDLQMNLPDFFDTYRKSIYQLYENTSFLPETFHDQLDVLFQKLEQMLMKQVAGLAAYITKIFDALMLLAVVPVLVFYMLKDSELFQSYVLKCIPKKYRSNVEKYAPAINAGLGSYIRGQLIVCLFVGVTMYVGLLFIDMKYPLILAIIVAVTNVIPYFGPLLGIIPAVVIAFTVSIQQVLYVIIVIAFVQIIEGNFLSPYIMGKSVHLHPVMIILILLIGGEIAGIFGMVVAIPLATVIKVIIKHSHAYDENHN